MATSALTHSASYIHPLDTDALDIYIMYNMELVVRDDEF
jgi:hypothetical protein